MTTTSTPSTRCYACGCAAHASTLRPFGKNAAGETITHICATCEAGTEQPVIEYAPAEVAAPIAAPAPKATRPATMLLTNEPRRNWCPNLSAAVAK